METYPGVESRFDAALPLFPVNDGCITVPEKHGLGIGPDLDMVKKDPVN